MLELSVTDIQRKLFVFFNAHKYFLYNSYVYDWECDYYSQSSAGYSYEVEIKKTRSDFFADFKKEKHRIFERVLTGIEYTVRDRGECAGSFIGEYDSYREVAFKTHVDRRIIYAPATRIKIQKTNEIPCPNIFYYACPEGIIKPEELPEYAGLIYVSNVCAMVKKGPYIHKKKYDLNSVLLQKFSTESYINKKYDLLKR